MLALGLASPQEVAEAFGAFVGGSVPQPPSPREQTKRRTPKPATAESGPPGCHGGLDVLACQPVKEPSTSRPAPPPVFNATVDSIFFADTAQLNGASRIGYAMFNDEISARAEMLRNEETVVCAYEITSVVPSLSLDINIL